MAGDWIKMRCNLGSDPRVLRMADGLKLPELHVVGLLWRFWSWADQHTTCDAISVTESLIDRITCEGFASQLREVGWLEVTAKGVVLTNFSEHNGQTAKQRALTQRRMKRKRDADVTQSASPEKRREEKRRDSIIPEQPPAKPVGERVRNPLFDALAACDGSNPSELTSSAARACGVALAEIRKATPSVTPEEIARRAANYRLHMPGITISPSALGKHWSKCATGPEIARNRHQQAAPTADDHLQPNAWEFSPQ